MGKDTELSDRRIWSRISFLEKKLESKEEKALILMLRLTCGMRMTLEKRVEMS
jgi:hypothetical protein